MTHTMPTAIPPSSEYNQTLLAMANDGLTALSHSAAGSSHATAAQQSHFLCSFMAQALKDRRYAKCIANDLTAWVRQGRSLGAGANLKSLLERIVRQYSQQLQAPNGLGKGLKALLNEAQVADFIVYTDTEISTKLKLDADGQSSLIICAKEFSSHIEGDELVKPLTLYARCDETLLAEMALRHGLMLTLGDKKASLVKHHKAYRLYPHNQLPSLALLISA